MYAIKTGRVIGELCSDGQPRKDILYIWKGNEKESIDENEMVYCLTSTCTLSFNPITGTVLSQVNHPEFLQLPEFNDKLVKVQVVLKSLEINYQPDRIYCVVKQDSGIGKEAKHKYSERKELKSKIQGSRYCFLTGYTIHKKKSYKFGQVNHNVVNVLFDANSNLVVKAAYAIIGKKNSKLSFFTPEGLCLDGHAVPSDRPITCISVHPTELCVATGDKSGKICVWRNSHDDPNRFFATQMHWHSLPVRSLSWMNNAPSDSRHLFSGGEEGALLKWDTRSAKRIGIVPRFGCTITYISAFSETVVTVNSNNSIKLFSATLEDITTMVGLARRKSETENIKKHPKQLEPHIKFDEFFQLTNGTGLWKYSYLEEKLRTKIFFHGGMQSVALLNGLQNRIQLFDPLLKTEKLALDVCSFNKVLGDRQNEDDNDNTDDRKKLSSVTLFSLSRCGTWLVTVETNWDTLGGQCLKIWHFSPSISMGEGKFELNTQINEDLACQVISIEFLNLPLLTKDRNLKVNNAIISCGSDRKAKLWRLRNYEEISAPNALNNVKWEAVRTFSYLNLNPTCSAGSPDQSVIAIGFGPRLTLWDSERFSLLTCLSVKEDSNDYTSVVFADGSKLSHLVLGTTETHVLVWNLLTSHLLKKMSLDRPTLFHLKVDLIGVLHSHGAIALDHMLNPSLITNLENVSGIARDNRTERLYLLHSTPTCENLLTCIKWEHGAFFGSSMEKESQTFGNEDDAFNTFLKHNVQKLDLNHSDGLRQTRVNSKILSHDLITSPLSNCSASFVKLSLPS